jgi:hypothetical protein
MNRPAGSAIGRLPRAAAGFALLASIAAAGCETPAYESNWNRLRPGMSRADVESMLGRPSSTYVPPPPDPSSSMRPNPVRGERWQYGDTLSSMATRAVFPDEADERAWCVFFGPDGTVTGFRPPEWADAKRSVEPGSAAQRSSGSVPTPSR